MPDWVKIVEVKNQEFLNELLLKVDNGEASAIVLASELQPSLLIIDDLKGRRLAKELHLNFTGTLGVFLKARQNGTVPSLRSYFDKIKNTNFHISHQLLDDILKQVGD
ncbi:MAG TPA: DUF3368 domain-containing protein [Parafilimonas sp.]|nr:DUF3368 domain-containing protein [Parafilimonas sp.]